MLGFSEPNIIQDGTFGCEGWYNTFSNLMLEGERSWNENLVQMLLLDENEANDVLRAPIYNCIHSDIRIWGHESNGNYC